VGRSEWRRAAWSGTPPTTTSHEGLLVLPARAREGQVKGLQNAIPVAEGHVEESVQGLLNAKAAEYNPQGGVGGGVAPHRMGPERDPTHCLRPIDDSRSPKSQYTIYYKDFFIAQEPVGATYRGGSAHHCSEMVHCAV
jgi:hypothetical protein